MSRSVSNCLTIMRLALARRNENDPDASDDVLLSYLNDFISFTMTDDIKLFEQFGTLRFTIDDTNTTGVYTFNQVGASDNFSNISNEGFITLSAPLSSSVSWNRLAIYQDPGQFFGRWGVNNESILVPGYPTEMLFYGTEMTFRTLPNDSYDVIIYGYKIADELNSTSDLPQDYWLRYVSYGASLNYARDYHLSKESMENIQDGYARERQLLLTRVHNQRKMARCQPRY